MPGKPCSICSDAMLAAKVDSLLQSGETYRAVASLTGVDQHKIGRHARHSRTRVTKHDTLTPLELSERRLDTLFARSEASWLAAASSGDAKVALDILKSQVRMALSHHERLLEKQEQATQEKAGDFEKQLISPSVEFFDECLRRAQALEGKASCPCCGSATANEKFVQSFLERNHLVFPDSPRPSN
jgi:hypothetical protein